MRCLIEKGDRDLELKTNIRHYIQKVELLRSGTMLTLAPGNKSRKPTSQASVLGFTEDLQVGAHNEPQEKQTLSLPALSPLSTAGDEPKN